MLKNKETDTVPSKKIAIDLAENVKSCRYTYGTLNIDKFVKKLSDEGIRDVKIEPSANGSIIHLVKIVNNLIFFKLKSNTPLPKFRKIGGNQKTLCQKSTAPQNVLFVGYAYRT